MFIDYLHISFTDAYSAYKDNSIWLSPSNLIVLMETPGYADR